ncbi:glycosyl hydrolase family 30 [Prolixibacteraceae bacterium JC049]|nr:glycosyl hydrolase family 30 [Prolixibacteraceae bacterium JC049]
MIVMRNIIAGLISLIMVSACQMKPDKLNGTIYETSAAGNKMTEVATNDEIETEVAISIFPEKQYQEIIGFGGSFTEASAYLLNQLSHANRQKILNAYFSDKGARYSLTRTHMNSCDFSLNNYSYAAVADDMELKHFSIQEDKDDIIPMIKAAQKISAEGFKIIASPWTAPPWMKDNNDWRGGKLLPKYYDTWSLFFSKYITAYAEEEIPIWAVTVENEPLGNNSNWESMHYTAEEMVELVKNHLGPKLKGDHPEVKILGYDQNRGEELKEWGDIIYKDEASSHYFDGIAVHWYASTIDWMGESLNYIHQLAPGKLLIQTEACVDAEVPHWKDDQWYWSKEATDWGWDWAPEEQKKDHPKYVPVYRYARDIIGCLNSNVQGWVDWNMVLDRQGGPNWFKNWCTAPVIVDPESDEVYFTPLYYTMAHFSKFMRPESKRIDWSCSDSDLMVTAVQNKDKSIVVALLNMNDSEKSISIKLNEKTLKTIISPKAIQTIVIPSQEKN